MNKKHVILAYRNGVIKQYIAQESENMIRKKYSAHAEKAIFLITKLLYLKRSSAAFEKNICRKSDKHCNHKLDRKQRYYLNR